MLQRACSIRSSSSKVLQAQCTSERFQLQNSLDTMSYHPLHSTSQQATHSKRTRKKRTPATRMHKGCSNIFKVQLLRHQRPSTTQNKITIWKIKFPKCSANTSFRLQQQPAHRKRTYISVGCWTLEAGVWATPPFLSLALSLSPFLYPDIFTLIFLH